MVTMLNVELKKKHDVHAFSIQKDDEVCIVQGGFKGREGKVIAVYRKNWIIHVDRITLEKVNGQRVHVGVDPSNCVITNLKMGKTRVSLLKRKLSKYDNSKESDV